MGWLNAVARPPAESRATKAPGVSLSNPSSWLVDLLGGPDSATGIRVTEDSALTSAAVWASVKVISETIAAFPLQVYRRLPSGGRQLTPNHNVYQLVHGAPNPEMTSMEWRETSFGHLLLWGNSYSAIERDNAFEPIALWPLRPDRMQVWRDPETHALTYSYSLWQGGTATLDPYDVMHVRTLSRDGILGMSPVGQMREAIGLGLGLERYGAALYGNGANPGGVISVPGVLSKDAKENLRRSWEEQHRGPGQVGRTAVLEQGVTWQATGMNPVDAEFLLSRTFNLQEIARIWRLPPHKLQDLSRATFSNIEQSNMEFVSDCLLPYLVRWEQRACSSLFQGLDAKRMFIRHTVDHLLRGDIQARYAAYAVGRQWGWLSADDVREKEDMNPLPDGQGRDYIVPMNMLPADQVDQPKPPSPVRPQVGAPDQGGQGGHSPQKQAAQDQAQRLLEAFLEDAARRIVAREDADICRAARSHRFRRDRREFGRWLEEFVGSHRAFVVRQVLPIVREVAPEGLAEALADDLAERQVRALLQALSDFADLADLEGRLSSWREQRPQALVDQESPRLGMLPVRALAPAPPPAPPAPMVYNVMPQTPTSEVRFEAQMQAPVAHFERGAIQATVLPAQIQTGDTHVTVQPPPPAQVQVDVSTPPVNVQQGDTHVSVQPAEVRAGDTHIEVHAPPAPPAAPAPNVTVLPAEVRTGDTHTHVEVQAAPAPPAPNVTVLPAEVRSGDTHVQVQAAPSPPAPNVTVLPAEVRGGDTHVEVHPSPTPSAPSVTVQNQPPSGPNVQVDVDVQAPEVRVENRLPEPPKAPQPRLKRAQKRLEMLENGSRTVKEPPNPRNPRQNRPRRPRRR